MNYKGRYKNSYDNQCLFYSAVNYGYLKELENLGVLDPNYDNKILTDYGINPSIRSCLIDSLFGLQDTFKFCDKTLFITVQIFDNYLSIIINNYKKYLIHHSIP